MSNPITDHAPLREKLNTWVQTIALVLAGIWAIYTFVFKEIWVPRSSPAFISADVDVSHSGATDSLEAIQLRFTLKNQGERAVYTLPSVATVWASRVQKVDISRSKFIDDINSVLVTDAVDSRIFLRHGGVSEPELVGVFRLFSGYEFLPNSTAANEVLIYVPPGEYDQLEVDVVFLVVSDTVGMGARWSMHLEGAEFKLFRTINGHATWLDTSRRKDREFMARRDFGAIDSYTVLSLSEHADQPN